jgi:hypothetical protein
MLVCTPTDFLQVCVIGFVTGAILMGVSAFFVLRKK